MYERKGCGIAHVFQSHDELQLVGSLERRTANYDSIGALPLFQCIAEVVTT